MRIIFRLTMFRCTGETEDGSIAYCNFELWSLCVYHTQYIVRSLCAAAVASSLLSAVYTGHVFCCQLSLSICTSRCPQVSSPPRVTTFSQPRLRQCPPLCHFALTTIVRVSILVFIYSVNIGVYFILSILVFILFCLCQYWCLFYSYVTRTHREHFKEPN